MTSDEKRAQAELMRKLATAAPDPGVRKGYLALAADWDRLARDSDDLDRRIDEEKKGPGRW